MTPPVPGNPIQPKQNVDYTPQELSQRESSLDNNVNNNDENNNE